MSLWPPRREGQAQSDASLAGASPKGRSGRHTKSGASRSEGLVAGKHVPDATLEEYVEIVSDYVRISLKRMLEQVQLGQALSDDPAWDEYVLDRGCPARGQLRAADLIGELEAALPGCLVVSP
jgi:hypothetical protein